MLVKIAAVAAAFSIIQNVKRVSDNIVSLCERKLLTFRRNRTSHASSLLNSYSSCDSARVRAYCDDAAAVAADGDGGGMS